MLGLTLALTSSLCWGVSDFVGGLQARRMALLRLMLATQAIGLVALAVVLAIRGVGAPSLWHLLPAMGGGLAGAAALSAFYRGLATGSMSIVAPISATGVAVPVVAGVIGGDRPEPIQMVGIVAAIIGIVLASRETRKPSAAASAADDGPASRAKGSSVALALLAALGFGCFFLGVEASAHYDPLWSACAARTASVAGLMVAARVAGTPLRAGGAWRPLIAIGCLDVSANVLYAIATRHGLLSIVSVAASLYPLATVLLARILLRERVRRVQEVGVVTALAGVLLIAAG